MQSFWLADQIGEMRGLSGGGGGGGGQEGGSEGGEKSGVTKLTKKGGKSTQNKPVSLCDTIIYTVGSHRL